MRIGQCRHDKCGCPVDGVDFCSDYCADRSDSDEFDVAADQACRCGHSACTQRRALDRNRDVGVRSGRE